VAAAVRAEGGGRLAAQTGRRDEAGAAYSEASGYGARPVGHNTPWLALRRGTWRASVGGP
jgi:hypothetical protein